MGNKPIHLRLTKKNPTGRQAMWEAIRANKDGFTLKGLSDSFSDLPKATLKSYVKGLVTANYIKETHHGKFKSSVYTLIKDTGVHAPKIDKKGKDVFFGQVNDQMWRAMKMLKIFTYKDLQVMASTEETIVKLETARKYTLALCKAGYLKRVENGKYMFIPSKNTGSRAPMIQRLKTVFDPNLCKIMWQQEANND